MGPSTSWSPVSSGDSHFLSIWRHHPPPPGNCRTYFSTLSLLQLFCWETTALFHGLFCLETCSLSMFLESSSRSCSCRRRLACGAEGQGVGQEAGNLCVFPAPLLLHPRVWKLNPRRGPNGWLHSPCPLCWGIKVSIPPREVWLLLFISNHTFYSHFVLLVKILVAHCML